MPSELFSIIFKSLMCLIACCSFAMILNCPKDKLIYPGITGAIGWFAVSILNLMGVYSVVSIFLATAIITAVSRVLSYMKKAPVTIFLIVGIFPLVPGSGIFETGYNLFMNNTKEASAIALVTVETAVVMAFAIGIVLSLPQVLFSFKKYKLRSKIEKDNYN